MRETYYDNMFMLGKHESGGITDVYLIDYIKELGFIDKNALKPLSIGIVWEYKDEEIHIDHIYNNTGVYDSSPGKGRRGDFNDETYTKEHEDLYDSILMYAELDTENSMFLY